MSRHLVRCAPPRRRDTLGSTGVSLHPVTDLVSQLDLEVVKPDASLGVSPAIGWDRIYGGQVVARALRAAGLTVAPEYRGHSLHAYFVMAIMRITVS